MEIDLLLNELKKGYGLKEKHIRIIKILRDWPLTAEQVAKQGDIPLGRVYEYLNQLIEFKILVPEVVPGANSIHSLCAFKTRSFLPFCATCRPS